MTAVSQHSVPEGFDPLSSDGFVGYVGPIYWRPAPDPALYLVLRDEHLNGGARAHGGLLMSLAEITCRKYLEGHLESQKSQLLSLNCDFVAGADKDQAIIGTARITRMSRSIAFVSAELRADDRILLTATGLYRLQEAGDGG